MFSSIFYFIFANQKIQFNVVFLSSVMHFVLFSMTVRERLDVKA